MDTSELLELIKQRRSIFPKYFDGGIVPKKRIDQMLEAANWAPTHRFTEPWRFVVFEGEGLKKLAEFQAERYKLTSTVEKFNPYKYDKLKTKPLLCSHMIAVCMKRDEQRSVPEIEEISAVACAVQNMLLVASSLGIGCYWGTGGVTYDPEAKEFFGIGPDDKLMGFLNVGSTKKALGKGKRGSIQQKVSWVN